MKSKDYSDDDILRIESSWDYGWMQKAVRRIFNETALQTYVLAAVSVPAMACKGLLVKNDRRGTGKIRNCLSAVGAYISHDEDGKYRLTILSECEQGRFVDACSSRSTVRSFDSIEELKEFFSHSENFEDFSEFVSNTVKSLLLH